MSMNSGNRLWEGQMSKGSSSYSHIFIDSLARKRFKFVRFYEPKGDTMLREALEDALARGEKLRQDITKEILDSQVFTDLANNQHFVNAVARVIRSKVEVARSLQLRIKEILEVMNIPTRHQVRTYEQRVIGLEKTLDSITRNFAKRDAKKTTAKKAKPRKKVAAKKAAPKKKEAASKRKAAPKKKTTARRPKAEKSASRKKK